MGRPKSAQAEDVDPAVREYVGTSDSVRGICARHGISPGTLYRYLRSCGIKADRLVEGRVSYPTVRRKRRSPAPPKAGITPSEEAILAACYYLPASPAEKKRSAVVDDEPFIRPPTRARLMAGR